MTMIISGDGTISGLSAGGLPSATVTQATLATPVVGTGPAFSAYQSTQQTGIASATFTKVNFQTEEFDTANCFASSTFTPNVAGYYQINSCVWGQGTFTGSFLSLYKNGSRYKESSFAPVPNNVGEFGDFISSLVYLNGTTDYVEIYVWSNSTGTYSLQGNPQIRVWFNGSMVRAA